MKYVLTKKDDIYSPVTCNKNSFEKDSAYLYKFEILCNDNSTAVAHVFNEAWIPAGYYDSIQSVPLSVFMRGIESRTNMVLSREI